MESEFEVPTWDRIYEMLLNLAEKIAKDTFKPDTVLAVSRGGWIPARVLCDLLGAPSLADVGVKFYSGVAEPKDEPKLTRSTSVSLKGHRVLIVDEVADTGKSLKVVKQHVSQQGPDETKIAVIYSKPKSAVNPDFFEKQTRNWIIFPWETKETVRNIIKQTASKPKLRESETARLVKAGVPSGLVERFSKEVLEEEHATAC
jgi:hypoxanthine phosphoribosyltransferase